MYMPRSQIEQQYALDSAEAKALLKAALGKWSARRTLVFVTSASCLLWVLIISAVNQLF
jgi:hypothetical protein